MKKYTCAICGKKAEYISNVNVSPLCESCMKKQTKKLWEERGVNNLKQIDYDDFYAKICDNIADDVKEFSFDLGEEY